MTGLSPTASINLSGIRMLAKFANDHVPATKTHPACTIHEDGMRLHQWLGKKNHMRKNLTENAKPQSYR